MKYTPEMLADAVRRSTTYAGVLRTLGIAVSGGAHSHIKRRIEQLGIDTSHFTGQGHPPGHVPAQRLSPDDILVVRAPHRRRAPGSLLTRALVEIGVPLRCVGCGIGTEWMGRALVLHVDHINGDPNDCRRANLRFLCPNCHSQTSTYAGRGKRERSKPHVRSPRPVSQVPATPMTVAQAASLLGCSASHFYRLRAKLAAGDEPVAAARRREARDAAIIACALAFPDEGPNKLAERLQRPEHGQVRVAHGTVSNVLRRAGLTYVRDRRRAAESDGLEPSPSP